MNDLDAQKRKPYNQPDIQPRLGRPWKVFDLEDVQMLAELGCTDQEFAAFFNTSTKTLERRKLDDPDFCRVLKKGRQEVKLSLRRTLLGKAKAGNTACLIFLAKNFLGMSDKPPPPIVQDDEEGDWLHRTRLASGDYLIVPIGSEGTDPCEAYHANLRIKKPKNKPGS